LVLGETMIEDKDLTVIFYTANALHEPFASYVRENLVKSIDGRYPIVTVYQKQDSLASLFGDRQVRVGEVGRSHLNIYRAVLRGAQEAQTEFVGLAEDDAWYAFGHWSTHRPPPHKFAYDFNKWGLNTWNNPPVFGYRARVVINHLIAPRDLLVASLEERFAKFKDVPDSEIPIQWWGDLGRYEKKLGCTPREWEPFAAPEPGLVFSHEEALGWLNQGARKSAGGARRTELPGWGSAQTMLDLWNEKEAQAA
jgi:hypothetical protein